MSPGQESRGSSIARSPSRDSVCSERVMPAASPILPAFPQPIHRIMPSPHGSVSPHVSSSSPPVLMPAVSPAESPETVLDFSTKRSTCESPVLNLSKSVSPSPEVPLNSPLDLSVSNRKRSIDDSSPVSLSPTPQMKKQVRPPDFKPVVSPWTSPVVASHFPYFAAAVAAANSLSPKGTSQSDIWNGKLKMPDKAFSTPTPSDATKALEKMQELSKLGGDEFRSGGANRHSAWQSHWLNKGADQAKDVLKCVWCKQSFPSLAAMTTHMKEAKHCGVNIPSPIIPPPPPPVPQSHTPVSSPSSVSSGNGKSGQNQDLNLLIKETMPLPRKLVRGQDVWLGKGAEQTRQILKCMWCGQSFRSLAEMTSHMQQTQHYTNIISQEQIISWKSADEGKSSGGGGGNMTAPPVGGGSTASSGGGGSTASSHVSAVLTCKVCDQAFSSLKELSNHMVKNSHYKEHIMRSITETGSRRRQTREKRKKSLPVRKLLELERAQNELKNGENIMLMGKHGRDLHSAGRITCEKCKEKIDMAVFVDHIRLCVGGDHKNLLKNALLSSNMIPDPHVSVAQALRESTKMKSEEKRSRTPVPTDLSLNPTSPKDVKQESKGSSPSVLNAIEKLIEKSFDSRARHGGAGFVGPGIPGQAPMGSSILKRLGIDESVDYTKPLVDPQTMNLLRNYHHQQQAYRRERSGSESSSISERGRSDVMTPDRNYEKDRYTPRTTPEKRIQTPPSAKTSQEDSTDGEVHVKREAPDEEVRVKREPEEVRVKREVEEYPLEAANRDVSIKQEMENGNEDDDDRTSFQSDEPLAKRICADEDRSGGDDDDQRSQRTAASPAESPSRVEQPSPGRASSSPASSDRSGTPRSSGEKKPSGSLGALSSMFDSLSGGGNAEGGPSGTKGASHPLAALQKLCDKTETHTPRTVANTLPAPGTSSTPGGTAPGAILAFSWACNDAVVTADSIMKCAFCDTPFISKGAYRHHLSKMHFVKDGVIPDPVKSPSPAPKATPNNGPSTSSAAPPPKSPQQTFEESPHSKFLKYTELAKQLSSKYV